jgi:hypothetical protein
MNETGGAEVVTLTAEEWNTICRAAGEHTGDACDALRVAVEHIIAARADGGGK